MTGFYAWRALLVIVGLSSLYVLGSRRAGAADGDGCGSSAECGVDAVCFEGSCEALPPSGPPCATADECDADTTCIEGMCKPVPPAPMSYRDEADGGDDVFKAGCHYGFTERKCQGEKFLFDVDRCEADDSPIILEWFTPVCHAPMFDRVRKNCDTECRMRGWSFGKCKWERACRGTLSAYCLCFNL